MCCKQKEDGGLGIKNIEMFNMALIGKWMWRALNEKNKYWVRVLEAKYGCSGGWLKVEGNNTGSIWWKDLKRVCQLNVEGGWLRNSLHRKLGNGMNIRF